MDAHVFRLLALELKEFMQGARVERIHNPAPGIFSLGVYSHGRKKTLVLRHARFYNHGSKQLVRLKGEKQPPALYLTERKLPNPEKPSTLVMTLRKYLCGRRLGAAASDWLNRRIFFPLPQLGPLPKSPCPLWFCLDLLNGPSLLAALPPLYGQESPTATGHPETPEATPIRPPVWPDFGILAPDHRTALENREIWRSYPVLTPALRKSLSCLEPLDAAALLADLAYESEKNSGETHLYEFNGAPHLLSAWPLPAEQLRQTPDLSEIPLGSRTSPLPALPTLPAPTDGTRPVSGEPELAETGQAEPDLAETGQAEPDLAETGQAEPDLAGLEAARLVHEPEVLAYLGASGARESTQAVRSAEKRLARTLLKLEQEEQRLLKLEALRADALLLQASLWRHAPDEKAEQLTFAGTETADGKETSLRLDPLKTIRENMAELFKQADRGKRGLAFIKGRRAELEAELELVRSGLKIQSGMRPVPAGPAAGKQRAKSAPAQGGKNNASRLIQRFVSSDGFVILRGRSAEGNWALLKLVQPHDVWLHVEGGPSAHVVIRRAHLGQDIPERTLREAGTLSALKSWRKNDSKAEIISALVKDVRPAKGGSAGSVLVDKLLSAFVVAPDPELEAGLVGQTRSEILD